MSAPVTSFLNASPAALHAHFLSILPRVEVHARCAFRHLRCPHQKEDAVAETVAVCWKWFRRLAERGKDGRHFPATLAALAARHVRHGRKLCGQEKAKDALSPLAQSRYGFVVGTLPTFSTLSGNPLAEALADNTLTPVAEQVCFRCDFPRWLASLGLRNRGVAGDLLLGGRTREVARRHGLSPGRVSQLRREFQAGWKWFCGEQAADGPTARV